MQRHRVLLRLREAVSLHKRLAGQRNHILRHIGRCLRHVIRRVFVRKRRVILDLDKAGGHTAVVRIELHAVALDRARRLVHPGKADGILPCAMPARRHLLRPGHVCVDVLQRKAVERVRAVLLRNSLPGQRLSLFLRDVHRQLRIAVQDLEPFLARGAALERLSEQSRIPDRRGQVAADRLSVMRPACRRLPAANRDGIRAQPFNQLIRRFPERREGHAACSLVHVAPKDRQHILRHPVALGERLLSLRLHVYPVRKEQPRRQRNGRSQRQHGAQRQCNRFFHTHPPDRRIAERAERPAHPHLQRIAPWGIYALPILTLHTMSSPIRLRSVSRARESPAHTAPRVVPMMRATSRTS